VETVVLTITLSVALMAILGGWAVTDSIVGAVQGREARDRDVHRLGMYRAVLPFVQVVARVVEHIGAFDGLRGLARPEARGGGEPGRDHAGRGDRGRVLTGLLGWRWASTSTCSSGSGPCSTRVRGICMAIPFLYLNDRIRKRQKKIRKVLPIRSTCSPRGRGGARLHGGALAHRRQARGEPVPGRGQEADARLRHGQDRGGRTQGHGRALQLDDLQSVVSALVQADELGSRSVRR